LQKLRSSARSFFYFYKQAKKRLAMTENFETITKAFAKAGIDIPTAEYSITEYSLNTDLSFKFSNLEEFLSFLTISAHSGEEKIKKISAIVVDAGIDPNSFFYVNFYKPKVAEL
jgi:hypothetical protein